MAAGTSEQQNSCYGCQKPLAEAPLRALGKCWHPDCFKCSVCERGLTACYFARQEVLFCRKDYLSRFRNTCHRCGRPISGPVIVIGDITFHTECLVCSVCKKFLSEADSYALLERHKLLCDICCGNTFRSSWNNSSHIIQHFVPSKFGMGQQSFQVKIEDSLLKNRLSPDGIRRESAALVLTRYCPGDPDQGNLSLKPGDKILEVNGELVNDLSLDHTSALLMSKPGAVFQITVERHPSGKARINRQNSMEDYSDDRKGEFRTRSISLFTRRVFKRSPHAIDHKSSPEINRKDGAASERDIKPKSQEPPNNRHKAARSSSLPRSYSMSDVTRTRCDIRRCQSFKNSALDRVFRPSDLLIGDVLGKGFFGQVLKVTHKKTGEVMVAKELLNFDEEAQANFLKEVALLKSLDHPNVLRFIGVLFKGRTLNLITEYVAGGTLRALLKEKAKPLSWSLRVKLARDIAAGMAYLHSVDVMHRDLKSKNCLIQYDSSDNEEDLTAVVADFGLAKVIPDRTASPRSPRTSGPPSPSRGAPVSPGTKPPPPPKRRYTVVGTAYWMAPEMLHGLPYDHTVDIFSFGIVLCEIIGRVKADPTFLPRLADFGLDEASFRMKFCSHCPEAFYLIAFQCCSVDPEKRPSFAQLETWLESVLLHLDMGILLPTDMEFSLLPKSFIQSITESSAASTV